MTYRLEQLSNGVRVLLVNKPHTRAVTVATFVKTGSANESKKLNGISHFLEHMAFKGTTTRDYTQIAQEVELLGADINAYTGRDITAYHVKGLKEHLPTFVNLLGDIMLNSTFPEAEIEQERNVIVQEYNGRIRPSVSELFGKTAYPNSTFAQTPIGTLKNIGRFTRQDFVDYMGAQYTAPNVILGVIGAIDDEEEVLRLLEAAFKDLPAGKPNVIQTPVYVGGIAHSKKSPVNQTKVLVAFKGRNVKENFVPDMIAANVIGGGMSSPLFHEIREKRGLVYSVGTSYGSGEHAGGFYMSAGLSADKIEEFLTVACGILKNHTHTVNPQDLVRAKNSVLFEMAELMEGSMELLEDYVNDLFAHGEVLGVEPFMERVQAVTAQDVMDSMTRLLAQAPTVAIVGKGGDDRFLDVVKAAIK